MLYVSYYIFCVVFFSHIFSCCIFCVCVFCAIFYFCIFCVVLYKINVCCINLMRDIFIFIVFILYLGNFFFRFLSYFWFIQTFWVSSVWFSVLYIYVVKTCWVRVVFFVLIFFCIFLFLWSFFPLPFIFYFFGIYCFYLSNLNLFSSTF